MTRWAVIFDDTPGMLPHRKKYWVDHLAYLKEHKDKILVGGGLRHDPDAPFVGGLWIVESETRDDVVELVLRDPYFNSEHRRFEIFFWGKAIEQAVTI